MQPMYSHIGAIDIHDPGAYSPFYAPYSPAMMYRAEGIGFKVKKFAKTSATSAKGKALLKKARKRIENALRQNPDVSNAIARADQNASSFEGSRKSHLDATENQFKEFLESAAKAYADGDEAALRSSLNSAADKFRESLSYSNFGSKEIKTAMDGFYTVIDDIVSSMQNTTEIVPTSEASPVSDQTTAVANDTQTADAAATAQAGGETEYVEEEAEEEEEPEPTTFERYKIPIIAGSAVVGLGLIGGIIALVVKLTKKDTPVIATPVQTPSVIATPGGI